MKFLFIPLLILLAVSCNKSGGGAFQNLENEPVETNDPSIDGPVVISSTTPSTDPVQVLSGLNTFAVQIEAGAGGNVTYDFKLDGVSIQDSTSPFYVLNGTGMVAGLHYLEVTASNPSYSDVHTFNLYVNSAPVLNRINNTATTISCIGGTFTVNFSATDVDNDAFTYSYFLNGATGSSTLNNTNPTVSSSATVFTPTCLNSGLNNIKVKVTDINGAYDEEVIAVTVSNPTVASITSYSPLSNPVIITSTATQTFQISPDGSSPFNMTWTLTPGGVLAACTDSSTCNLNSNAGARVGSYTLNVLLEDQGATPDDMDFNIFFNAPPVFGANTPSNSAPIKMKCSESESFTVNITDQNGVGVPQTHSVIWTYGGDNVQTDTDIDQMFTVTTNVATHPFSSTLTFNPNCDSAALQGEKEIKVVVSDGFESVEEIWDVSTSYFSSKCLNLNDGEICTLAGLTGMGDNINVTDNSTRYKQVIIPRDIIPYDQAGGMFISDINNDVIWFYNHNSSGNLTVFGQTVGPKKMIVLFGTGLGGVGTNGETFTSYYLNDPYGMAWDSVNQVLYVSDSGNHRIVQFTGTGSVGAGTVFAGNSGGANVDGAARLAHKCNTPTDIELIGDKLYAACYGNTNNNVDGMLKYFNVSANTGYSVARYQAIVNTAGTINNYTTAVARTRPIYAITRHPTKDIIFAADLTYCQVQAYNSSGSSDTFMGVTVANNSMELLTSSVTCGNIGGPASSVGSRLTPYALYPRVSGATFEGLYIANQTAHTVSFLNFTGSSITVGNRAVATNSHNTIMGTGTADHARLKPASTVSLLNNPRGIAQIDYSKVDTTDSTTKTFTALAIADITNGRIAYLDADKEHLGVTTAIANGDVGDMVGNYLSYGYDGETDIPANEHRFFNPTALKYNSITNELLVVDNGNARIRAINLSTGKIRTKVGTGAAGTATGDDPRLSTTLRTVRDMDVITNKNALVYSDYQSAGANLSCYIRILNEKTTAQDLFATNILPNYVETFAGNYALGCGVWSGLYENVLAVDARLNDPFGIMVDPDGDQMYFTNRTANCILKMDNVGFISTAVGDCIGAANDIAGSFTSARFNLPGDIEPDPDPAFSAYGNFFFVDRSFSTGSFIKYVNLSSSGVDLWGNDTTPISAGNDIPGLQVAKYFSTTDGYVAAVAVYNEASTGDTKDGWICYSQGSGGSMSANAQNVICSNRKKNQSFIIGRESNPASSPLHRGRRQMDEEQEGVYADQATLSSPYGLAFDSEGNLYIADYLSHSIKMVKKWW
jgi:hypothetical protein